MQAMIWVWGFSAYYRMRGVSVVKDNSSAASALADF